MGMVGSVVDPPVDSVWFDTQKAHFDERVKHALTERTLDAAEPLRLFQRQPQSRHFQVLATDAFEQSFVWHGALFNGCSKVFKQCEVVAAVSEPRPHAFTLRNGDGVRDGVCSRSKDVLVGTGSDVHDVDVLAFPSSLSDDNVTVFRCRACRHDCAPGKEETLSFRAAVSAWREGGLAGVDGSPWAAARTVR